MDNSSNAAAGAKAPAAFSVMPPGFYNMDCMQALAQFPDGFFDLAIVDPPYGGGSKSIDRSTGLHGGGSDWEQKTRSRFGQRFDRYHLTQADSAACGGGANAQRNRSADTDDQSSSHGRNMGGEVQPARGRLRCSRNSTLGHSTACRIFS